MVQHFSDSCRKLVVAERFPDEINSFLQNASMGNHIGCVTGHIQALEIRSDGAEPFGQFPSVHLRHHHIRDQQLDVSRMLLDKMSGTSRCRRCKDLVAKVFENHFAQVQDRFIVFDQQDGFRTGRDFAELTDRLGVGKEFTEGRTAMEWLRHLYDEWRDSLASRDWGWPVPGFDEFWAGDGLELPVASKPQVAFADFSVRTSGSNPAPCCSLSA